MLGLLLQAILNSLIFQTKLVNLIHSMGGCIKKDLNTKTTHLICNHSGGEKYQ